MQTPPRKMHSPPTTPNGKKRKRKKPPDVRLRYFNRQKSSDPDVLDTKLLFIMPDFAYYTYGFEGYRVLLEVEARDNDYSDDEKRMLLSAKEQLMAMGVSNSAELIRGVKRLSGLSVKIKEIVVALVRDFIEAVNETSVPGSGEMSGESSGITRLRF